MAKVGIAEAVVEAVPSASARSASSNVMRTAIGSPHISSESHSDNHSRAVIVLKLDAGHFRRDDLAGLL